jgi:TP901 family phage tail tape measure protein
MSLAASYGIAAIFSAKDRLSPVTKKLGSNYAKLGLTVARVNKGINRVARIGGAAALAGTIAFTGMAVREFINLDDAVTQAGAKFKDLDVTSTNYGRTLDALSQKARDVGAVTEYSATDAAGALDKMAMAGLRSDVSMALLMGTTNLATAAGTDLTSAVDIATDAMGAFGLKVDETATATEQVAQAKAHLSRVSDVMAKTTTTANTDLSMLFEAVKAGAASFTAAGQSLETFNAAAGIMANAGIKGSMAGTSLRNVMLKLADPSAEAASILKKLGVETADADGNFRDMVDILADMEKGLAGMGSQQRTAALSTIFGARTVTGINTLLAAGTDELRRYRGELMDSARAAETMAGAMRGSLKNQIAVLKSSLTELGLKFVESFEKDGRGALQGLIEKVQSFDMTKVTEPIRKLSIRLKRLNEFVQKLGGWGKIAKIVLILAGSMKIFSAVLGIMSFVKLATDLGGVTAAMTSLNMAFLLSPITWTVLGITAAIIALTVGIIALVRNWDSVKQFFSGIWEWAKKNYDVILLLLGPLGILINTITNLVKRWDEVKAAFKDGGLLGAIKAIGQIIWDSIVDPIMKVWELIQKINPFGEAGQERREDRRGNRAERRDIREQRRNELAAGPASADLESLRTAAMFGQGTITVRAEDGTSAEVDAGTMPDAGWDMTKLGRAGAA